MAKPPSIASAEQEPQQATLRVLSINEDFERYSIPLKFRKMENLHIVFWLFKDLAWCMGLQWLGMVMIVPTFVISVIIAYRTRQFMSELAHNLAISLWIGANSYWMISEFLHFDHIAIIGTTITYKHIAIIPFVGGMLILAYYYLYWRPRHKELPTTM